MSINGMNGHGNECRECRWEWKWMQIECKMDVNEKWK